MNKVIVLVEGYAREENGQELASSTATLIRSDNLNIVVDPGMNREMLLDGLAKEKLGVEDINYVILTHTHLDHCLLAGIFPNARIFDNSDIYSFDGKISGHEGVISGTDIKIIKTPGHDQFHCSVLVITEDLGRVAIAGDVFWWRDDEIQKTDKQGLLDHEDPYVKDEEALRKSRSAILEMADYVIPGHGKIIKIT